MSRRAVDPLARAVAAFRDLTAEQQSTFLLAVALAGTIQADAPTPRKRTPRPAVTHGTKEEAMRNAQ